MPEFKAEDEIKEWGEAQPAPEVDTDPEMERWLKELGGYEPGSITSELNGSKKVDKPPPAEIASPYEEEKEAPVEEEKEEAPVEEEEILIEVETVSTLPKKKNLSAYEAQKLVGIRRSNGRLNRTHLKPKHKRVIALHLLGKANRDIAEEVGYNMVTVHEILTDPLAQPYIEEAAKVYDNELKMLMPDVLLAIRLGLQSDSIKTRFEAIDRYVKLTKRLEFGDAGEGGTQNNTFNFNFIQGARERLAKELISLGSGTPVLDLTAKEEVPNHGLADNN